MDLTLLYTDAVTLFLNESFSLNLQLHIFVLSQKQFRHKHRPILAGRCKLDYIYMLLPFADADGNAEAGGL